MNSSLTVWCFWVGGLMVACVGTLFILGPEGASNVPKNSFREKFGKILVGIGVGMVITGTFIF
ncbi:MAG: hypothetical protein PHG83_01290 [Patescibacteria group bacterium]|nr:hypothetical protein [Patescibacteria group bacterium]